MRVGDRVSCIKRYQSGPLVGDVGIIVEISDTNIGVDWEEFNVGHSCGGKAKFQHGWNMPPRYAEVINLSDSDIFWRTVEEWSE